MENKTVREAEKKKKKKRERERERVNTLIAASPMSE